MKGGVVNFWRGTISNGLILPVSRRGCLLSDGSAMPPVLLTPWIPQQVRQ